MGWRLGIPLLSLTWTIRSRLFLYKHLVPNRILHSIPQYTMHLISSLLVLVSSLALVTLALPSDRMTAGDGQNEVVKVVKNVLVAVFKTFTGVTGKEQSEPQSTKLQPFKIGSSSAKIAGYFKIAFHNCKTCGGQNQQYLRVSEDHTHVHVENFRSSSKDEIKDSFYFTLYKYSEKDKTYLVFSPKNFHSKVLSMGKTSPNIELKDIDLQSLDSTTSESFPDTIDPAHFFNDNNMDHPCLDNTKLTMMSTQRKYRTREIWSIHPDSGKLFLEDCRATKNGYSFFQLESVE